MPAIQAESAPAEFWKIEIIDLEVRVSSRRHGERGGRAEKLQMGLFVFRAVSGFCELPA
jgi:hypothetical protein